MALCRACKNIPTDFFRPVPENFFSPADRQFHYYHHTPTALRQSSDIGCPMCKVLSCQLNDDWLPQEVKDSERLIMKRAIIGPEQGFALWMGADDVSHNHFFVMPPTYVNALPEGLANGYFDSRHKDELMRHWINDCIQNHAQCRSESATACPTRLLDLVRCRDTGDIVLVDMNPSLAEHVPYVTLSYCWGPPSTGQATTTLANLAARKDRIRYNDLPQTIQDAIVTTRKLGVPFLWVDALCIIQDSPADWEREAAKMASIYAGSVCTLSALDASDVHKGFSRPTETYPDFSLWYDLSLGTQRIRVFAAEPNNWSLAGPLMNRAWTFQERALSRRIIHFSRSELLWECKTMRGCSDLPWIGYQAYDGDPPSKLLYDNAGEASGQSVQSHRLRARWFQIVENYSRRQLTYPIDKLTALSGLAHSNNEARRVSGGRARHAHGRQDTYAAGLWKGDLPSALLWRTDQQALRVPGYRAPSWSWACLDGRVTYDSQRISTEPQYGGIWLSDEPPMGRKSSEHDFGFFHVQGLETTATPADPMGAVSAGHLILKGLLAVAIMDETTFKFSPYGCIDGVCTLLRDTEGDHDVVGVLFADIQTEVEPYEEVYCLSVRDEIEDAVEEIPKTITEIYRAQFGNRSEKLEKVMGLALVEDNYRGGRRDWRRLGIVRWMPKDYFTESPSTVRVV